jgi:hypothetical protein
MSNNLKLAELRGRTDQELLVLIGRELDHALTLADAATNRESASYGEAERCYRKVLTLLPEAPDMRRGDRARIEGKVKELRFRLDQLPETTRAQRHTASFASGG